MGDDLLSRKIIHFMTILYWPQIDGIDGAGGLRIGRLRLIVCLHICANCILAMFLITESLLVHYLAGTVVLRYPILVGEIVELASTFNNKGFIMVLGSTL